MFFATGVAKHWKEKKSELYHCCCCCCCCCNRIAEGAAAVAGDAALCGAAAAAAAAVAAAAVVAAASASAAAAVSASVAATAVVSAEARDWEHLRLIWSDFDLEPPPVTMAPSEDLCSRLEQRQDDFGPDDFDELCKLDEYNVRPPQELQGITSLIDKLKLAFEPGDDVCNLCTERLSDVCLPCCTSTCCSTCLSTTWSKVSCNPWACPYCRQDVQVLAVDVAEQRKRPNPSSLQRKAEFDHDVEKQVSIFVPFARSRIGVGLDRCFCNVFSFQ